MLMPHVLLCIKRRAKIIAASVATHFTTLTGPNPSSGVGADGDTGEANNEPYAGWYYNKTAGAWVFLKYPFDAIFQWGSKFTGYRNPATVAALDGRTLATHNAAGTLQFRNLSTNLTSASIDAGVNCADGNLGFGPVTDPTGNGQSGWMRTRAMYLDAITNGSTQRCEPSHDRLWAVGETFWRVCRVYHYSAANGGLAKLTRTSPTLFDGALQFQFHDGYLNTAYPGGLAPYLGMIYMPKSDGTIKRGIQINGPTWTGAVCTGGTGGVASQTLNVTAVSSGTVTLGRALGFVGVSGQPGVSAASGTASGSISLTTLTIGVPSAGGFYANNTISGTGVTSGTTIVTQLSGTAGGAGTYQVSISQTVVATSITASGYGANGTTGTGGAGTYRLSSSTTIANGTSLRIGRYIDNKIRHWDGGTPHTTIDGVTGNCDPAFPLNVEEGEALIWHVRIDHVSGQAFTRVWHAMDSDGSLTKICDTTIPNCLDPSLNLLGSSAAIGNDKGPGLYPFWAFVDTNWDWKFDWRNYAMYANIDDALIQMGYDSGGGVLDEALVADAFWTMVKA